MANNTTGWPVKLNHTVLELLPERAVYWPSKQWLLIADLHLGKAEHFQKNSIPLSNEVHQRDYNILEALIRQYKPEKVIFLGDLFHSRENTSVAVFAEFIKQFTCEFILIEGNHDIMQTGVYQAMKVNCIGEILQAEDLILSHEPLSEIPEGLINVFGHIHPGYRLRGKGMQTLLLPCFALSGQQFFMPAFGATTGLHSLKLKKGELFLITGATITAFSTHKP